MTGAIERLLDDQGQSYTLRNAARSGGGREVPSYSDDGTITGSLRRTGNSARVVEDSDGAEHMIEYELVVVLDGSETIREMGESEGFPTQIVGDQATYLVAHRYTDDSGATVLSLVEN